MRKSTSKKLSLGMVTALGIAGVLNLMILFTVGSFAPLTSSVSANSFQTPDQPYEGTVYAVTAAAGGDRVQIKMVSASFDSLLILNKNNGATVATDDNSGDGQDAQITFTLPETGVNVIVATPFAPNRTGSCTLSLTRTAELTAKTESPLADFGRAARLNHEAKGANDDARFQQFANRRIVER